jgi:lipopolysaccharide biosynthesis glycosyltransferase
MRSVIVTAFDQKYMKYASVMLKSLAINYHNDKELEVICLVPKGLMPLADSFRNTIAEHEKLKIEFAYSERYNELLKSKVISATDYVSEASYLRLFISSLTQVNHDTAIYIDADALIARDFSPLLNYPIRNHFMAVLELNPWGKVIFGNEDLPYFNAGVFITNLQYWRENKIEDNLLNRLISKGPTHFMDQDLLNSCLLDVFAPLPNTFNVFSDHFHAQNVIRNIDNPLVIHFAGYNKPWIGETEETPWVHTWRTLFSKLYPEDKILISTRSRAQFIRNSSIYKKVKFLIPIRFRLWVRSKI